MTLNANISSSVFGSFLLSYHAPIVKDFCIEKMEFSSLKQLHNFLSDHIKKELIHSVNGYLNWRTNRFQFISIRVEWLEAVSRLKKALEVLPNYSLQEVCGFILSDNGIIDLMMVLLPKADKKTYQTAFNKIQNLEAYAYALTSSNTHAHAS